MRSGSAGLQGLLHLSGHVLPTCICAACRLLWLRSHRLSSCVLTLLSAMVWPSKVLAMKVVGIGSHATSYHNQPPACTSYIAQQSLRDAHFCVGQMYVLLIEADACCVTL